PVDRDGETRRVGLLRRNPARRTETVTFEYDNIWLAHADRFSIAPALALTRGVFAAPRGQSIFRASSTTISRGRSRCDRAFLHSSIGPDCPLHLRATSIRACPTSEPASNAA